MSSDDHHSKVGFSFFKNASLPLSIAILILLGVLLTTLGLLLFPVNLGIIPFSADGQLGLLLIIIAIQMLALGETPIGRYKRSWLLITIGIVFAAIGIVSCIVPGILTGVIQILIGLLNIIGGIVLMIKRFIPILHRIRNPPAKSVIDTPIPMKLLTTSIVVNIVTITFGIIMLVPTLVSGLVIAGILVINGLLIFMLAYFVNKAH